MTEVVKSDKTALERFKMVRDRIDLEASVVDRESMKEWIAGRLADMSEATSFAELNEISESSGLTPSKNLVNHTLTVEDFTLIESSDEYRENSFMQKYAIVRAVDMETGEGIVLDGGGDNFVTGLVRMRDLYGFPFTGTITAKSTGAGALIGWRWHDPKRPPTV